MNSSASSLKKTVDSGLPRSRIKANDPSYSASGFGSLNNLKIKSPSAPQNDSICSPLEPPLSITEWGCSEKHSASRTRKMGSTVIASGNDSLASGEATLAAVCPAFSCSSFSAIHVHMSAATHVPLLFS